MAHFRHPTYTEKCEGTYIVKNTRLNEYVLYSEVYSFRDDVVIYDHRDIVDILSSHGISDELELSRIDDTYSSTFMEA